MPAPMSDDNKPAENAAPARKWDPQPPDIARKRKMPISPGRPRKFTHDELARLIVQGLTATEISRQYRCSESTVIKAKQRMRAEAPGAIERAQLAKEKVEAHAAQMAVAAAEAVPVARALPKKWTKRIEPDKLTRAPTMGELQEQARIVMGEILLSGDDVLRANAAALVLKLPAEPPAAPVQDDDAILAEVLEASETADQKEKA